MIDAEQRRRIAAAYTEHVRRQHQAFPGVLSREDARALGDADGPEPAPTVPSTDEAARAAVRLFDLMATAPIRR